MKNKKEIPDHVVKFAQSLTSSKQFRHDYPLSDELRYTLLSEVLRDFVTFTYERYFPENYSLLEEYIDEHYPREEKRETLEQNLIWWQLLYQASLHAEKDFIESYIFENYQKLNNKPLIIAWLREWKKVLPKFYYVGYKYNDQVLVLLDMYTTETLDVVVYDPLAIPPKKGEIVMGILIPLGDALYFPIIDFYHFDLEASQDIAGHFNNSYEKHLKDSTHLESFIHILSEVLQIERIFYLEK